MKPINWAADQDLLGSEFLRVRPAMIYMLTTGRNAWHSTWVGRYNTNDSVHASLEDAQKKAEPQRVQGTVFTIREVPVLRVDSTEGAALAIEFHSDNCFGRLDLQRAASVLRIGTPMAAALQALGPNGDYWKPPRISQHSFLQLRLTLDDVLDLRLHGSLYTWTSRSNGPRLPLGWVRRPSKYTRRGILAACREYQSVNGEEQVALAGQRYDEGVAARIQQRDDAMAEFVAMMESIQDWPHD